MSFRLLLKLVCTFSIISGSFASSHAQRIPPGAIEWPELPTACVSAHDVGKIVLGVSNKGHYANNCRCEYYFALHLRTLLHLIVL